MTDSPESPSVNRPYPPPSNVIMVLKRLQARNLPERIDGEYLRDCGVPGGTVTRTLSALRFIGVIADGGVPTQALRDIHSATEEEYRSILAKLLRAAYIEVFNVVDPADDSQERIANVFRKYSPASQRMRMVIFFLGMCREAGIPIADAPRQRGMGTGTGRPKPTAAPAKRTPANGRGGIRFGGAARTQVVPAGMGTVHPALAALIQSLPEPGIPMPKETREHWLAMARATLGFLYPVKFSVAEPTAGADEEVFEEE